MRRNKKQIVRLNESQLKRIIKESVRKILNEEGSGYFYLHPCELDNLWEILWEEYDWFQNIPDEVFRKMNKDLDHVYSLTGKTRETLVPKDHGIRVCVGAEFSEDDPSTNYKGGLEEIWCTNADEIIEDIMKYIGKYIPEEYKQDVSERIANCLAELVQNESHYDINWRDEDYY